MVRNYCQYHSKMTNSWIPPLVNSKGGAILSCCFPFGLRFQLRPNTSGKPEDFSFCVAEGSNQSLLFELRPDRVKNYDFTLRRLDSEALRLLQRWGEYQPEYLYRDHRFKSLRAVAQIEFYLLTPAHLVRLISGFFSSRFLQTHK